MSESAILYRVAPFPILAYIIVRGFAKPILSLGIKGKGNRAIPYYSRVSKLSKG